MHQELSAGLPNSVLQNVWLTNGQGRWTLITLPGLSQISDTSYFISCNSLVG